MHRFTITAIALGSALALTGVAAGQGGGDRQDASVEFRQDRPDRGTAMRVKIDYMNPNNPGGKPFSVRRVVMALARGSRIRTGVPAKCRATDAQLVAQGRGACPRGSVVGDGLLNLDTGSPAQRIIRNRVVLLNNRDELIFLLRSTNTPQPVRTVNRAEVTRRKIISVVPPVPGQPPPDAFTAIKRVRLGVQRRTERHEGRGRSYIETPRSCPPDGDWVNRARFTYRDDVTQTEATRLSCVG
jgi:hypothetical protein